MKLLLFVLLSATFIGSSISANGIDKPDKPNENIFYISFADIIGTIKLRNITEYLICDIWYSIGILDTTENIKTEEVGNLTCKDEFINVRNLTRENIYKVEIKACNEHGCSDPMMSREYRNDISSGHMTLDYVNAYWIAEATATRVVLVIPSKRAEYSPYNYYFVVENRNASTFNYYEHKNKAEVIHIISSAIVTLYDITPSSAYKFRIVDKSKGIFFDSVKVTTQKLNERSNSLVTEDLKVEQVHKPRIKIVNVTDLSCEVVYIIGPNSSLNINRSNYYDYTIYPGETYTIDCTVIGDEAGIFDINIAKDECIAELYKLKPAMPKISDFDISFSDRVATFKLHNSSSKSCEIWYLIRLKKIKFPDRWTKKVYLHCTDEYTNIKNLEIEDGFYHVYIMVCNERGCFKGITSEKDYQTDVPLVSPLGPEGTLKVLETTNTTCRIQWNKPGYNFKNVRYYIKSYIEDDFSSEVTRNFVSSSFEPSITIKALRPGNKHNIVVGCINNRGKSKNSIQAECNTYHF